MDLLIRFILTKTVSGNTPQNFSRQDVSDQCPRYSLEIHLCKDMMQKIQSLIASRNF